MLFVIREDQCIDIQYYYIGYKDTILFTPALAAAMAKATVGVRVWTAPVT